MGKSWREKLRKKDLPKIIDIPEKLTKKWGRGKMVIPSPMEVKEIMDAVPYGKLITVDLIRERIAKKHGVDIACPLTTGIFIWIVANAAEETGGKDGTPYWRTLKKNGMLNEKYPGGIERHKKLLEKEGHEIMKKGKRFVVANYEKFLWEGKGSFL